jgi:hypothetical protein
VDQRRTGGGPEPEVTRYRDTERRKSGETRQGWHARRNECSARSSGQQAADRPGSSQQKRAADVTFRVHVADNIGTTLHFLNRSVTRWIRHESSRPNAQPDRTPRSSEGGLGAQAFRTTSTTSYSRGGGAVHAGVPERLHRASDGGHPQNTAGPRKLWFRRCGRRHPARVLPLVLAAALASRARIPVMGEVRRSV